MSVERIEYEGEAIAFILRGEFDRDGVNFFTENNNPLQLGLIKRKAGERTEPHMHMEQEKTIKNIQEVLHIDSGSVIVDFYTNEGKKIFDRNLKSGDTILLMGGGHGLRMLEDSRIIEVKQGPYDAKNTIKLEVK